MNLHVYDWISWSALIYWFPIDLLIWWIYRIDFLSYGFIDFIDWFHWLIIEHWYYWLLIIDIDMDMDSIDLLILYRFIATIDSALIWLATVDLSYCPSDWFDRLDNIDWIWLIDWFDGFIDFIDLSYCFSSQLSIIKEIHRQSNQLNKSTSIQWNRQVNWNQYNQLPKEIYSTINP